MRTQAPIAEEMDRYARHRLMEGWDQERVAQAHILVAGAGAIGNEVIKLLALMGVGHLFIVDFDTIEITNLTRSVLFRESDIGQPKALVAARQAHVLNPDCEAYGLVGDLEYAVGGGLYREMDAVIGCLDSLNARLALNRVCRRVGVPWLNGAIEATIAEVSLFGRSGVCFECGMTPEMWARRNRRYSCGGLQAATPEDRVPTTATVASLCAAYLVNEALSLLHWDGVGPKEGLDFGQKLFLMTKPYVFQLSTLPAIPECLAHEVWEPIRVLSQGPAYLTGRDLLAEVGMPTGTLELGFDLLLAMHCPDCGATEAIRQPLERCSVVLNRCPGCGGEGRYSETLSWIDAASPLMEATLASLGIPEYGIVSIKDGETRRYVQVSGVPV